jgi:hypothetical protein
MRWCKIFGMTPVVIDLEAKSPRVLDRPPYCFRSIEQAVEYPDFKDLTWIWCDHRAEYHWDGISLPKDNVMYCIGHDETGFQGYRGDNLIKLALPTGEHPEGQFHATEVVVMLLYEVYK